MVITPTNSRPSTPQNLSSTSSSSTASASAPKPNPADVYKALEREYERQVSEKITTTMTIHHGETKHQANDPPTTTTTTTTSPSKKANGTSKAPAKTNAKGKTSGEVERGERSKYLEEYARCVRTPRAQSARGSASHVSGHSTWEKVSAQGTSSSSHQKTSPDKGMEDDDVFDCLPLSAWHDDTLIGLPSSYDLYDKFQKFSAEPLRQRASSAKPSERKKSLMGKRLISSSKGPRSNGSGQQVNYLNLRERATTPTRAQRIRQSQRESMSVNSVGPYTEMDVEPDEDPENARSSSISEWPNSLRIVVPYKLKAKQRGVHPFVNPNLHHHSSSGTRSSSSTTTRDTNNYFGYESTSSESREKKMPAALRVKQQRNERERERSAALAKARLLSNYRNRHNNKIHENEEPLQVKKALDTTHIQPIHSRPKQQAGWRKYT